MRALGVWEEANDKTEAEEHSPYELNGALVLKLGKLTIDPLKGTLYTSKAFYW